MLQNDLYLYLLPLSAGSFYFPVSAMLVPPYRTVWRHIPEHRNPTTYRPVPAHCHTRVVQALRALLDT